MDVRGEGGTREVKIRWKGYKKADDTWEPVTSIKKLKIWKDFVRAQKNKVVAKPVGKNAGLSKQKRVPIAKVN